MTSLVKLRQFLEYVDELDMVDSYWDISTFQEFMQKAKDALDKTDHELAEMIDVSRPTVTRWLEGKNSPHLFMRRGIINLLVKAARLEEQNRSESWP
jgi:predicted transcriptional regulator